MARTLPTAREYEPLRQMELLSQTKVLAGTAVVATTAYSTPAPRFGGTEVFSAQCFCEALSWWR